MRCDLAVAAEMIGFVQQDRGAFYVIHGAIEEIRVEGDDLEGEVGRCIGLRVADPAVSPVVRCAKADQAAH